MAKDDKKAAVEAAGKEAEKSAAPRDAGKAPKKLSRAELEELRQQLHKKFH